MASRQPALVKIPIDETGEIVNGRTYWQQKVQDVAYSHLDVFVCNFKHHTPKQQEAIHADLVKLFFIDPPLKLGNVEKYLQKHLSFTMQIWKQLWKVQGDVARLEGCPVHVWNSLMKYSKFLTVKHVSERMQKVRMMVSNPWKMGWMSLVSSMFLEVEQCYS